MTLITFLTIKILYIEIFKDCQCPDSHLCASVTKQYKLVLVTSYSWEGNLVESNSSLLLSL